MGARPSSFKRGGGFLNGVDAMITGYAFVVGDTVQIKKGARKGEDFTPLTLVPTFRVDGADEDVSQRLLVGDAERFGAVSEDGLTLDTSDGQCLAASSEAAIFIGSLCENGFPDTNFSDSEAEINLEPMIGTRVRLVQIVNEAKTLSQGKQKNAKTGKEYDRRDLKVEQVLDLPSVKAKSNGAAKGPVKVAGKAAKVAKGPDVSELAAETLIEILTNADDNTLVFPKLKMKVFGMFGAKHPQRDQRDAVLLYLGDTLNLADIDGVEFNSKTQELSLA